MWCFFFYPITGPVGLNGYIVCGQEFLFSIVNPHDLEPRKLPPKTRDDVAVFCKSEYGPTFGEGYDLHISGNANRKKKGQSVFSSYSCPEGKQTTFFTGARNFTVSNYEVFGLSD